MIKKLILTLFIIGISVLSVFSQTTTLGQSRKVVEYYYLNDFGLMPDIDTINGSISYCYGLELGYMFIFFNDDSLCFLQLFVPLGDKEEIQSIAVFNKIFKLKNDNNWHFKDRKYHCILKPTYIGGDLCVYFIFAKEIKLPEIWNFAKEN